MPLIQFAILFVLLIFSAFFSGVETALMSLNMIKVNSLLKQKKKGSKVLSRIKKNPHKLIITILIGNNLVNIGAASLATVVFTEIFGSAGVGIATGVMTILILVFGEITPKTYATQNAERISLLVARPIELLSIVLTPLVILFGYISKFMSKLLGSKKEKELSEEELKTIVTMGKQEGILTKEAAEIMHNVLAFEDTRVTEIMTPKVNMKMLDGSSTLKEVIDFLIKSPYSLYPVYGKNRDSIIGILDIDDILSYVKDDKFDTKISGIIKDAVFVPESKEIDDLLTEFEGEKMPMAIVVDEYGGVVGMVTIEDILEEIVGEIFDKSKKKSIFIKDKGATKINASVSIEEFNEAFGIKLKADRFNTLAGYIEEELQRIPRKGEKIKIKDITLVIDSVTKQRVRRVRVEDK